MISTFNIKKYIIILIFLFSVIILPVNAKINNKNLVNIYFFHSNDCSHCQNEEKILTSIEEKYDNVKIYRYEIHEEQNNQLREKIRDLYDIKTKGVPLTIIGDTPYSGYLEEKSNIIFIKTIEYYSKYGYIDRVGEILQLETSSASKIDETIPTLEEFIDDYGNYKIIGSLYTDDLALSSNTIILGILSQFNIIKLISIIIILILLTNIGGSKNKLCLLAFYLGISFLLNTTYIINNQIYTLIIEIIILILFMLCLLGYNKNKKRQYLYSNIFIIIAIITSYLESHFYGLYQNIFKELMRLHSLFGINKINYYSNYLFVIFIINILLVLMFYNIKKIILKRCN